MPKTSKCEFGPVKTWRVTLTRDLQVYDPPFKKCDRNALVALTFDWTDRRGVTAKYKGYMFADSMIQTEEGLKMVLGLWPNLVPQWRKGKSLLVTFAKRIDEVKKPLQGIVEKVEL